MNLLIMIPTYNERDNIKPLVGEILSIVPEAKVLIVDDNSTDGTWMIAEELARNTLNLQVLRRRKKEGLGLACVAGLKEALKSNPEYIIQMDADFSHDPGYILGFLKEIESCDLVIGSRFLESKKPPPHVTMLSRLANRYARWMLGLKIRDCLGGYKCVRSSVIRNIELDKFISRGFVFQVEFLYRAIQGGFQVKEMPIRFCRRKSGQTKKTLCIICEAFFKVILLRLFENKTTG